MNAVLSDFNDVADGEAIRLAIDNAKPPADLIDNAVAALETDAGAVFEPDVLAALRTLRTADAPRFARIRAAVKQSRAVSMVEFDRKVITTTSNVEADMFPEQELWGDAVNGAELLTDISSAIRAHVVADSQTYTAAALWAIHTWLIDVLTVSPIANVTAPEMQCGKSVLLTALGRLANRPMQVSNIAPAALFRSIEAWQPTLLIDEVDSFLSEHEEARGIINSGFTRESAFVVRCVGDDHTPTKFSTWGAKALCGIGKIADTLADRSIPLRLRRKTTSEKVSNIRHADPQKWEVLRAKIARWADDHRGRIMRARPHTIDGLGDRANDCWEPLLAIAEAAGGEWPKRARSAAQVLHGLDADAPTIGVQLLGDIRDAFGVRDRIATTDLLAALIADEETPWPTWNRGRPMTARQLSSRLGEFSIRPNTLRIGAGTFKGYMLEQFNDAFGRYIPAGTPVSSVTPSQVNEYAGCSGFPSVTRTDVVTDTKHRKANAGAGCDVVTDRNTPHGAGWEASE